MNESHELIYVLLAIVSALYCICVAGVKDRSYPEWFLLGAVLPVLAPIAITYLPPLDYRGRPVR